jgi:nucleoside-diphosphate-sugar epimerase
MGDLILLTGGRGFFGRRIAEALEAHGHEVLTPGRPDFDLMDLERTRRTVLEAAPATIVHSAAYYGGLGICMEEPARLFFRNVVMTANLLEAAGEAGVGRFVSIGSACAYPGGVDGDMKEEDYWAGALHPSVEAYGFTKKVQQVGVNAYGRQFGMKGQFPIITNLYGEHDVFGEYRSHVVAALVKKFTDAVRDGAPEVSCWGTGAPVREFLYVGDAAEAVARLVDTGYEEPLNLGTGVGTTIRELAETIGRLTGFTGEIRWGSPEQDGVPRKVLDVSRMREVLGWEPPTSLQEGLRRTLDWYLPAKEQADARE